MVTTYFISEPGPAFRELNDKDSTLLSTTLSVLAPWTTACSGTISPTHHDGVRVSEPDIVTASSLSEN
jgi:hypothetical protein